MEKSLVALAALAATAAFAQSSVTISGIVDANYQTTTQVGEQKANLVGQNGARTTTFKFNGVEDLGAGQAAVFQFEVQPSYIAGDGNKSGLGGNAAVANVNGVTAADVAKYNNAANPSGLVGKGQSFVGYTNTQLGNIKLGTINTNTFGALMAVSALQTGIGSGYGAGNVLGDVTRVESAMSYESPSFYGISAGVLKGTGNDASYGSYSTSKAASASVTPTRSSVVDYGLTYANGPLAVKYAVRADTPAAGAAGVQTTKVTGASYDAGVAKIAYGMGTQKKDDASLDSKFSIASVIVPFMGTYRAIAQQATWTYDVGAANKLAGAKNKITGWAIEKDLSKRTFVYLRNESADFGAADLTAATISGAAGTADMSSKKKVTAVGISHAF